MANNISSFKASKHDYFIDSSEDDEDYIDMEIINSNAYSSSSSSSSSCLSNNSNNGESFEFQLMPSFSSSSSSCWSSSQQESIMSTTADELFHKGNLLPLHLPPRLQMLQTIQNQHHYLKNNNNDIIHDFLLEEEETFTIFPFTNTSPVVVDEVEQSSHISPSESCRVSFDDEDQYCPITTISNNSSSSSSKYHSTKLKHYSLGKKLIKASTSYLKSLFFPNYTHKDKPKIINTTTGSHSRKSFSGVIHRHNYSSSSSSSGKVINSSSSGSSSSSSSLSLSSSSSSSYYDHLQWLKRSCSTTATLDLETSIEGAIAHCKHSSSKPSPILV